MPETASEHKGMGAILYPGGTAFRLWAKFATQVFVAGEFNNWSETANPLVSEGNGYWSVDVPGAMEGEQYRYVIHSPFLSTPNWRTDPYARRVENDKGNGFITSSDYDWGMGSINMPEWNELVIYELHVGTFYDLYTDGIPGDFEAITRKLDYLKDLGINAIELLPIYGFPGKTSLGYNPALPFDIESSYGTNNDFKNFIKTVHENGIAIILDVVYNHLGPDDLDTALWRIDGWYENGGGGIYFYNDWRRQTAFGDRPDFGRPEVRQFIRDNVQMWLNEYRVDGLRFDSTINIRNVYGNNNDPAHDLPEGWELMQQLNDEIDLRQPWKITIAEDLQNNDSINLNTGSGGAGFDSQWDSSYYWPIRNALVTADDENRDMNSVKEAIQHRFGTDPLTRIIYSENHDEVAAINHKVRLPESISPGFADSWYAKKRSTLGAVITFTSPGIPMIFMGQEFLSWGSWHESTPMDWSNLTNFGGIHDLYQRLIQLRRNWENNTRGLLGANVNVFHINNDDKLIAYHRWENGGPGDDVIVVINFANRSYDSYTIGFPQEGIWHVRFNSDWRGYSPDFGNIPGYDTTAGKAVQGDIDGLPYIGDIGIGPYSALILSQ
jgi:1,4-alpha-glucan branching enzyme